MVIIKRYKMAPVWMLFFFITSLTCASKHFWFLWVFVLFSVYVRRTFGAWRLYRAAKTRCYWIFEIVSTLIFAVLILQLYLSPSTLLSNRKLTVAQLLQKSNNTDAVGRKSCNTVFLGPCGNNLYTVMCFTKWCTLPQQLSLSRIPVYLWHVPNCFWSIIIIIIILAPVPTLEHVTATDFRQNKNRWRWRGNTLNKFSLYCSRFSKRISTLSHSVSSYTHPSPLVAPVLPCQVGLDPAFKCSKNCFNW